MPARQAAKDSITIMPQSDEHALCVTLHGTVSLDDYKKCFYSRLKQMLSNRDSFHLLVHYGDDYEGWDEDAAKMSFQSIIDHGKQAKKMAYVNSPESRHRLMEISQPLLGGEVRYFNGNELEDAIRWIKT